MIENNGSHRSIILLSLLQHSHCTFVTILFGPFAGLFVNLAMCIRALFPTSASTLGLVNKHSGGCHFSQYGVVQVHLRYSMHGHRDFLPLVLFPLGLRVLDAFLSFCRMKELGERFGCVNFARLFISWRKLQLSPFEHCPLAFPLPTISKNSLYTLFCSLILDHGVLLIISISAPKISVS